MPCFKLKDSILEVIQGDITGLSIDAIVNPANSMMIMGGGVAGAIKRRGGRIIEEEAMSKAPVQVGEAISTTAGSLPARMVIHAPTMERPAMRISPANVYKATQAALKEAERSSIDSIAFPAMGAGVGGVPVREAFKTMIKAILEYEGRLPARIVFVAWGEEAYTEALEAAREMRLGESSC